MIKESVRINGLAVTITSLTTIVGFLALNFSDARPYHDLGNITAVGIAIAWAISLAFLPAVMSLLPLQTKDCDVAGGWSLRFMDWLSEFVIRRYRSILVGFGIVAVALIAVILTIYLDDQWVKYFDRQIQLRGDAEFAIEHLAGLYSIEYSVEASEPRGISN